MTTPSGTLWYYGRLAEILPTLLTDEAGARLASLVSDEYRSLLAQVLDDPREATDRVALEAELDQARPFEEQAREGTDPEPRDA